MLQLLMASCLLSPASGEEATPDGAALKDTFVREAPRAWERYAVRAKRLQGSYTITTNRYSPSKKVEKDLYEIKQAQGCAIVLEQGPKRGTLRAANPQYAFELKRSAKEHPWVIAGVGKKLFDSRAVEEPVAFAKTVTRRPCTFTAVSSHLDMTILDPGFSIKRVSSASQAGQQLVRVEFKYSPSPEGAAREPLRAGSILYNPEQYWTINRLEVQFQVEKEIATDLAVFEYRNSEDGFPILQRIVHRKKNPTRNVDVEYLQQFELQEFAVPESEFRLSALGFSEPVGVVWEEPIRWYVWFIGAAVVSLAVGAYLWHRVRRRRLGAA